MEILEGRVTDVSPSGVSIFVPGVDPQLMVRMSGSVQVGLPDGRTISPEQRKKAHALLGEIAEWMGDLPEYVKRLLKMEFMVNRMQALEKRLFSLSDCDMTTAREFISFLIDFMVEHGVPSRTPLWELCEDIEKYVYACLMHKRCAICGDGRADLHHVDQVGMGRDRTDIIHLGMRVLPLCRIHHGAVHQVGRSYWEAFHLTPISLTPEIGKVYGLSRKNLGGTNE